MYKRQTIFYPCWQWNAADLEGIASIKVRAGQIPYYFQLAHDEPNRRFEPSRSKHGELDIHAGGCKGELLASVPLPATPDKDGFITLSALLPADTQGKHDLCPVSYTHLDVYKRQEQHLNVTNNQVMDFTISRPDNAGAATIKGLSLNYQQNLGAGFGVLANYCLLYTSRCV